MFMSCFRSSSTVVPAGEEDPGNLLSGSKGRKGPSTGRLTENEEEVDRSPVRSNVHSAPANKPRNEEEGRQSRAGVHSAPSLKLNNSGSSLGSPARSAKPNSTEVGISMSSRKASCPHPDLGEFVVERADGVNAADVDEYLRDTLGSKLVKELRSADWAERVRGIEALQGMVMKTSAISVSAVERMALFRACISVLARMLQDKIVPVYLPALQLLTDIYVPSFLGLLPDAESPRAAVPLFAGQLVFRAGSSNVRAREESAAAYLHLARCEHAGPSALCPHALRPLANSKSQHAAVGRCELLRTLVNEFGVSHSTGLDLKSVLEFIVPLCESASEKSRDAAFGVLTAAHGAHAEDTLKLLTELNPNVAAALCSRMTPESEEDATNHKVLAISGHRLSPLEGGGDGAIGLEGKEIHALQTLRSIEKRTPASSSSSKINATRVKNSRSPQTNGSAARLSRRQRLEADEKASEGSKHALALPLDGDQTMVDDTRRHPSLMGMDDEVLMDSILGAAA